MKTVAHPKGERKTLAWSAIVQLVVFFNSGSQWILVYPRVLVFVEIIVINGFCVFAMVREPLCEPKFFCIFVLSNISVPRVKLVDS